MPLNTQQYHDFILKLKSLLILLEHSPQDVSSLIAMYKREYETQGITSTIITESFDLLERIQSSQEYDGLTEAKGHLAANIYPIVILRNCLLRNSIKYVEPKPRSASQHWQSYFNLLIMTAAKELPVETQQALFEEIEETKASTQEDATFLCQKYNLSDEAFKSAQCAVKHHIVPLMKYNSFALAYIDEPLIPIPLMESYDVKCFFPEHNKEYKIESFNSQDVVVETQKIEKLKKRIPIETLTAHLSAIIHHTGEIDGYFTRIYKGAKQAGINIKIEMWRFLPSNKERFLWMKYWKNNIEGLLKVIPLENLDFSGIERKEIDEAFNELCTSHKSIAANRLLSGWVMEHPEYWSDYAPKFYLPVKSEYVLLQSLLAVVSELVTHNGYSQNVNKFLNAIAKHFSDSVSASMDFIRLLSPYPELLNNWLLRNKAHWETFTVPYLLGEKVKIRLDSLIGSFTKFDNFEAFLKHLYEFKFDSHFFASNQLYLLSCLQEKEECLHYLPDSLSFEKLYQLAESGSSHSGAARFIHEFLMKNLNDEKILHDFYRNSSATAVARIRQLVRKQTFNPSADGVHVPPYINVMQMYHQFFLKQVANRDNIYRKNDKLILEMIESNFYDDILRQVDWLVKREKKYTEAISVINEALAAKILQKPESTFSMLFSGKLLYAQLQETKKEIVELQKQQADNRPFFNNDEQTNKYFGL